MIHPGRQRRPFVLLLALAVVGLAGCSNQSIEGTVTLDGSPVDGGSIRFTPKDARPGAGGAGGPIVGGKYMLTGGKAPAAGSYRVDINWEKKTGAKVPTPGDPNVPMDQTVETIPPNYNSSHQLTADVKSGSNTLNFDLKSQPGFQPGSPSQPQSGRTPAKGD